MPNSSPKLEKSDPKRIFSTTLPSPMDMVQNPNSDFPLISNTNTLYSANLHADKGRIDEYISELKERINESISEPKEKTDKFVNVLNLPCDECKDEPKEIKDEPTSKPKECEDEPKERISEPTTEPKEKTFLTPEQEAFLEQFSKIVQGTYKPPED